ncbi:MAG: class I SAM-dependent methyltransferase [Leptospiraceae bacterium]|nr:class I SAM-dependent methyltransferase [Leptospiraceae bacterium]
MQKNATVPTDLESLYSDDYYSGQSDYSYRDERKSEEYHDIVWQARLKTIAKTHRPPGSFLDIGCSFGGFVDAASRFGYRAVGLDLSSFAVEEGRRLGRDLRQGELSLNKFGRNQFDVITMIEVMEHLPDPLTAIQCICRWLKPGGLLVIQTANFLGRQAIREGQNYHYYLPGHLHYYSSRNLSTFLGNNGFVDFHLYRGVDFGLLPKLKKMRGQWKAEKGSKVPLGRLAATSMYHLKSRIAWRDFALTSSMVLYARKGAL